MIELRRNNDAHNVQLTTFATTKNKMNHLLPIKSYYTGEQQKKKKKQRIP